ncbi:hypothetical protein BC628DRAFT_1132687 [Trametes gibbosa]|nr:hypothetical protein BC628DRAFT_1132687 [Trametes gibbosa]
MRSSPTGRIIMAFGLGESVGGRTFMTPSDGRDGVRCHCNLDSAGRMLCQRPRHVALFCTDIRQARYYNTSAARRLCSSPPGLGKRMTVVDVRANFVSIVRAGHGGEEARRGLDAAVRRGLTSLARSESGGMRFLQQGPACEDNVSHCVGPTRGRPSLVTWRSSCLRWALDLVHIHCRAWGRSNRQRSGCGAERQKACLADRRCAHDARRRAQGPLLEHLARRRPRRRQRRRAED